MLDINPSRQGVATKRIGDTNHSTHDPLEGRFLENQNRKRGEKRGGRGEGEGRIEGGGGDSKRGKG